jgi:hypothetical protein
MCPGSVRKIAKDLNMDREFPQRDLNLRPTEFGAEELPTQLEIR